MFVKVLEGDLGRLQSQDQKINAVCVMDRKRFCECL